MAGEIIMSVAYGINVLPSDDPYITLAHKAVYTFSIAFVPGLYLVVSLTSCEFTHARLTLSGYFPHFEAHPAVVTRCRL